MPQVLLEAVKLAVALLNGGHRGVQESFWRHLSLPTSEDFFKEIHHRFCEAQAEIKNYPMGLILSQEVRTQRVIDWYGGRKGLIGKI